MKTDGESKSIACVTGGSGLVGRRIVRQLQREGYIVRILTRKIGDPSTGHFHGDINNETEMKLFLSGAKLVFHCAAEINDPSIMWKVNVQGTQRLWDLLRETGVEFFCYVSSAGVIGRTREKNVDENTPCHPETVYEQSKWAAEQIVRRGIPGRRVAILRPTNVVDEQQPGALALPIRRDWPARLKTFLKGGECAHIVHSEDVAAAAMHLISRSLEEPTCFFVSCDHEALNTYAGLWSLYKAIAGHQPTEGIHPAPHLPLFIPYLLRKIVRGTGNHGDVRYSSGRLLSTGFRFPLGLEGAIRSIASSPRTIAP